MKKDIWFKQKRYGWGWTPANWKGWLVLAVWVALFVLVFRRVNNVSHSISDVLYGTILPEIILTAIIWAVCWIKGEKPRWRWG